MKKSILFFCGCVFYLNSIGQVAINTDASTAHASAMLDIKSNSKGFLPPRMTWTQIQAIPNPAKGLVVFDDGVGALRLYDGNKWVVIGPRIYEINDPPGDFNMEAITGSGTASGLEAIISPGKTIYIGGFYTGVVTFGNVTLTGAVGLQDLFVAAYDSLANLLWVKTINGDGGEFISELKFDPSGNILVSGNFSGTLDLDPGPGTDSHTASGMFQDAFFAKYDNNLNLIWGRHLGSTNDDRAMSIVADLTGNVFVTGNFSLTVDFDPGPGIANLNSAGSNDVFIARYDINGNWVWSNRVGGTGIDQSNDIELLSGTVLVGGIFAGTVDFDPSGGLFNMTSSGGSPDVFHARYDIAGGFLWAKRIGGTMTEALADIVVDASGNFWSLGRFEGTCDMDPDGGVFNLLAVANDNTFFAKYTSAGALSIAKQIFSSAAESPSEISLDQNGNLFICGSYFGSGTQVDFDPNAGEVSLTSVGSYDSFVAKYDPAGSFLWVADMGGSGSDVCNSFSVSPDGKLIFLTGQTMSTRYFGFSGERILNGTQFFLARYEE